MKKFSKTLRDNWIFLLMVLPGALWLILFFYIPVFGNVVAFKDYHMTSNGFIDSIVNSKWVGLDNFRFLFSSKDAFIITRNTVLYNLGFIFIGLIVSVGIAIILSELRSKRMVKIFQTSMLFPYFLSWVIISFFTDAFLNIDKGVFNHFLTSIGMKEVNFYADLGIWPYLLLFLGIWKGFGYSSVMYYATIMGIDPTYYEAATVERGEQVATYSQRNHSSVDSACNSLDHPCSRKYLPCRLWSLLSNSTQCWSALQCNQRFGRICL